MSSVIEHAKVQHDRRRIGSVVAPVSGEGRDRRGPFRPGALVSPRARFGILATERIFRAAEGASIVALALLVAGRLHPEGLLNVQVASILPLAMGAPLLIACLSATRTFDIGRRERIGRSLARICGALLAAGALIALLVLFLPRDIRDSEGTAFWFALSAGAAFALHLAWWTRIDALRRAGRLTPNIVIVGATPNAEQLIQQARESRDVAVLGVFDDRLGRAPGAVSGVPILGDTKALLDHKIMPYVDRVVITVPSHAQGRVRQLIERLRVLPNEVSLFLDIDGEVETGAVLGRIADAPLAKLSGARLDEDKEFAKRVQDLILGSLALIAALPVMAVIAIAIKLDSPGPVLFRQKRHGFNNEPITVWKFRSMHADMADATASRQVTADDERITRVGRFIRSTSLDELPQLFNVLAGDMSLVGPRPHAIGMKSGGEESARLVAEYAHRHRMKPGLTGWAAIHGSRGPVDTAEQVQRRVALDVEYIDRQSIWLDLYVLLMTVPCLLGDRAAVR